jgi:hypothetical protein
MYEISNLTSGKSMNPKLFLNNLQFSNEINKFLCFFDGVPTY